MMKQVLICFMLLLMAAPPVFAETKKAGEEIIIVDELRVRSVKRRVHYLPKEEKQAKKLEAFAMMKTEFKGRDGQQHVLGIRAHSIHERTQGYGYAWENMTYRADQALYEAEVFLDGRALAKFSEKGDGLMSIETYTPSGDALHIDIDGRNGVSSFVFSVRKIPAIADIPVPEGE
jgi:hypothetical protein